MSEVEKEDIGIADMNRVAGQSAGQTTGRELRGISISEATNGYVLNFYSPSQPGPQNQAIASSLDEVLRQVGQHFA